MLADSGFDDPRSSDERSSSARRQNGEDAEVKRART
jgi:hypothetical protein